MKSVCFLFLAMCSFQFSFYNVRLKFVIFCGHEHIYFDKNLVVTVFVLWFTAVRVTSLWVTESLPNILYHRWQMGECVWDIGRMVQTGVNRVIKKEPLISVTLPIADSTYFFFWTEASRCAYKRNIILNSVHQHNHFITQGIYIGYRFRL